MIIASPTCIIDYGGVCMMRYYLFPSVSKGNQQYTNYGMLNK